ncbi:tetratricopeptide repeat protein [Dongia sedimenti]|uniref:Tetratricopeptide repeat protein n=1 Tax=Dongia sedimenti TaxID=3064282 RepID=A0ABU0YLR4_9PROT|nr:tetratricopeptide repeat protein [Rhodospirillaceae bacterium R-7]
MSPPQGSSIRFGIVLALLVHLCPVAYADALQDGTAAFANKDSATALRLLAPLADAGDPIAFCMVTVLQDRAHGRVAYDADGMAATCIAAARGETASAFALAGNYRTGLILERDAAKAASLTRRAAEQGLPVAQKVLGDLYAEGAGVPRDFATACRWWGRAALQGESSEAARNFGKCHLTGTGVPPSETEALTWWLIAKKNARRDQDGLPGWVFQSEADADRLTAALMERLPADEVAEAQRRARLWQPVRADRKTIDGR